MLSYRPRDETSWIFWVGFKSNDRCAYETLRRGGGNVTSEAEIRVIAPQAKGHLKTPEAGRDKELIL